MPDDSIPIELRFTGNGQSLAAMIRLQSDARFLLGKRPENQSEGEFDKRGFPVRPAKPHRPRRKSERGKIESVYYDDPPAA